MAGARGEGRSRGSQWLVRTESRLQMRKRYWKQTVMVETHACERAAENCAPESGSTGSRP